LAARDLSFASQDEATDDRLENTLSALVFHDGLHSGGERVVLAAADPNVVEVASAGEILAVFVERNGKHAVSRVERLLAPVVDVDVHHPIVLLEKLKDVEDATRDGAETGGLVLFAS
jgi:hypothetical protein